MKPRKVRLIVCQSSTGVPGLRRIVSRWPRLRVLHEVVAAAETLAGAGERDHVHRGVQVRLLYARGKLAWHLERDPVAALGPVESDPGDPAR